MKRNEIFWLVGTIGMLLIVPLAVFAISGLNINATLDLNVHDTYLVIAYFHIIILIFSFSFFLIYLLRTIRRRFKNITANIILMLATILIVLLLGKMIGALDFLGGTGVDELHTLDPRPVEKAMHVLSKILRTIQIGLLVLLAYCGFKTGLNYNSKENTEQNNT